jgi:MFS transporter, FHS family, Na+ dependent glucose transporter 1
MAGPGGTAGAVSRPAIDQPAWRHRLATDPAYRYLLTFVAVGLLLSLIGPALSELRRQVGVSVGTISVLFVVQSLGYLAGSIIGGRLYDRGLGHLVIAGALGVCALAMVLLPAAGTLAVVCALFAVVGLGGAAVDVGGNTLLVWSRGDSVGPIMNALHLCFGIGALASPILVDRSLSWGGDLRLACWTAAGLSLVGAGVLVTRPAPARTVHADDPSPGDRSRRRPPLLLVAVSGFFLLYVGVELGFAGWVHTYAEEIDLGGPRAPALLTALFWVGFTGGRLLAVVVARLVSAATMLAGSCTLAVVAAGGLVLADGRSTLVWVGTFVFGLGVAPQFPTMISFADAHLRLTATDTSWFIGAAALGGLVLPWVIGQLIGGSGAGAMPLIVFIAAGMTLASFIAVRRIARGHVGRVAVAREPVGAVQLGG